MSELIWSMVQVCPRRAGPRGFYNNGFLPPGFGSLGKIHAPDEIDVPGPIAVGRFGTALPEVHNIAFDRDGNSCILPDEGLVRADHSLMGCRSALLGHVSAVIESKETGT